jgi:uncharacterized protein (TIGR00369 family)
MGDLPTELGGFDRFLGLVMTGVSSSRVSATLDVEERHHQPYGITHGGVYCSLVESLASMGAALWAMERGMLGAVGVSNTTDFLRAHRRGRLEAVAVPIHQGRSQQLWQVDVRREADGKPVARGQVRLHNLADHAQISGA